MYAADNRHLNPEEVAGRMAIGPKAVRLFDDLIQLRG